jgi:membrane-associated phospholipid phosphatase
MGTVLVVLCYYFVDAPVAWFVHEHRSVSHRFLLWLPTVSDYLKGLAALGVAAIIVWRVLMRGGRIQRVLLALSFGIIGATLLKQGLKQCFGRTWPEGFKPKDGPTLIHDGVYGFHPFHHGSGYESFPSGHAAVICAVMAVLWCAYPRARWLFGLIGFFLCVAMVGLNYHFVGDVIAGSILGAILGVYTAALLVQSPR